MNEAVLLDRIQPELPPNPHQLDELFKQLNLCGVRYCNWKSSIRIPDGLVGKTDLDLLVDPADSPVFRKILQDAGVIAAHPAPGKDYPGIENYLGFDPASGRLFHLHVHYELVLGEQFVKNYRLPLEGAFLEQTIFRHGVRAPLPQVEVVVLCLRALLKYRDRDALKDYFPFLHRSGSNSGLPHGMVKEIRWLLEQTSLEEVSQTISGWHVGLRARPVIEFLTLVSRGGPWQNLWRLRRQIRSALQGFQRRPRLSASLDYFREDWRRKRRIFKPSPIKKMTIGDRGVRIAFIGVDGAGKSTVTQHIARWLSWRLDVRVYYMGKTRDTLPMFLLKPLVKLARSAYDRASHRFPAGSLPVRLSGKVKVFFEDLAALLDGHARLRFYRDSFRKSREGAVILYDRYPMESVQVNGRQLDGPRIAAKSGVRPGLGARLARSEERLYRQIQPPDHVILLQISSDLSQARKPEHNSQVIAARARTVEELSSGGPGVAVIHADEPLNEVVAQVKRLVWNYL